MHEQVVGDGPVVSRQARKNGWDEPYAEEVDFRQIDHDHDIDIDIDIDMQESIQKMQRLSEDDEFQLE